MSVDPRTVRFGENGAVLGYGSPEGYVAIRDDVRGAHGLDVRGTVAFALMALTVGPWIGIAFVMIPLPVIGGMLTGAVAIENPFVPYYFGVPAALPTLALMAALLRWRERARLRWVLLGAGLISAPLGGICVGIVSTGFDPSKLGSFAMRGLMLLAPSTLGATAVLWPFARRFVRDGTSAAR